MFLVNRTVLVDLLFQWKETFRRVFLVIPLFTWPEFFYLGQCHQYNLWRSGEALDLAVDTPIPTMLPQQLIEMGFKEEASKPNNQLPNSI